MAKESIIPYDVKSGLHAEMPAYLQGQLDAQEQMHTKMAIYAGFFLVFVLPVLIGRTTLGAWLAENQAVGLGCVAALAYGAYLLIEKWPSWLKARATDKAIRLRIKLGHWPEPRRDYPRSCYRLTKADITKCQK